MNLDYLPFEQEIAKVEEQIAALKADNTLSSVELSRQIKKCEQKSRTLTEQAYAKLTSWQMVQVARHPKRPYTLDYLPYLFIEFQELKGDRHFAEEGAIVAGLALFEGRSVMVMGHQKGRTTQEKVARNFGMPRPEGYRKALRLMQLAEKFKIPVITLIDTPGAYPGIDAEERNQSEAIAKNLQMMAALKTPIVSIVIGEGGSGGALAIGVADRLAMLHYSIYSVISPEGCASILWKDASNAALAAEAMGVTATQIAQLGLLDVVLPEPTGGAHRNVEAMAATIKSFIQEQLDYLTTLPIDKLVAKRQQKLLAIGAQGTL